MKLRQLNDDMAFICKGLLRLYTTWSCFVVYSQVCCTTTTFSLFTLIWHLYGTTAQKWHPWEQSLRSLVSLEWWWWWWWRMEDTQQQKKSNSAIQALSKSHNFQSSNAKFVNLYLDELFVCCVFFNEDVRRRNSVTHFAAMIQINDWWLHICATLLKASTVLSRCKKIRFDFPSLYRQERKKNCFCKHLLRIVFY